MFKLKIIIEDKSHTEQLILLLLLNYKGQNNKIKNFISFIF